MPSISQLTTLALEVTNLADQYSIKSREFFAKCIGKSASLLYSCFAFIGQIPPSLDQPHFNSWTEECCRTLEKCRERLVFVRDAQRKDLDTTCDALDSSFAALLEALERCISDYPMICVLVGPQDGFSLYQALHDATKNSERLRLPVSIASQFAAEVKVAQKELGSAIDVQRSAFESTCQIPQTVTNTSVAMQRLHAIGASDPSSVVVLKDTQAALESLLQHLIATQAPNEHYNIHWNNARRGYDAFAQELPLRLHRQRMERMRFVQSCYLALRTCAILRSFLRPRDRFDSFFNQMIGVSGRGRLLYAIARLHRQVMRKFASQQDSSEVVEPALDLIEEYSKLFAKKPPASTDPAALQQLKEKLTSCRDVVDLRTVLEASGRGWFRLAQQYAQAHNLELAFQACLRAAESYFVDAQVVLSENYGGRGESAPLMLQLPVDPTLERKWQLAAARAGDEGSQLKLIKAHLKNPYVCYPEDITPELHKWVQQSAEHGNVEAQVILGDILSGEVKSPAFALSNNLETALKYYYLAANQGDKQAKKMIARAMEATGEYDLRKLAIELRREVAMDGDPESCLVLCLCHLFGTGVSYSQNEAMEWARRALPKEAYLAKLHISAGDQWDSELCSHKQYDAFFELGVRYALGLGVPTNPRFAVDAFSKCRTRNGTAACYLGMCYERGFGHTRNYNSAIQEYQRAANEKVGPGYYLYGDCLERGIGVKKDVNQAFKIFMEGATLRSPFPPAMYRVGQMLEQGIGRDVDLPEAVNWYTKAADLGDVPAMRALARLYREGTGVEPNVQKADELLEHAERLVAERNDPARKPSPEDFWLFTEPREPYAPFAKIKLPFKKYDEPQPTATQKKKVEDLPGIFYIFLLALWILLLILTNSQTLASIIAALIVKPIEDKIRENREAAKRDAELGVVPREDDQAWLQCVTGAAQVLKSSKSKGETDIVVRNLIRRTSLLAAALTTVFARKSLCAKSDSIQQYINECLSTLRAAQEVMTSCPYRKDQLTYEGRVRVIGVSFRVSQCIHQFVPTAALLDETTGADALRHLHNALARYRSTPDMGQQLAAEQALAQDAVSSTLKMLRDSLSKLDFRVAEEALSSIDRLRCTDVKHQDDYCALLDEVHTRVSQCLNESNFGMSAVWKESISIGYRELTMLIYNLHSHRLQVCQALDAIDVVEWCSQIDGSVNSFVTQCHEMWQQLMQQGSQAKDWREAMIHILTAVDATLSASSMEYVAHVMEKLHWVRDALSRPVPYRPTGDDWLQRSKLCLQVGGQEYTGRALPACIRAATDGSLQAQCILAQNYGGAAAQSELNLHVVPSAYAELHWLSEAALRGHQPSQMQIIRYVSSGRLHGIALPTRVTDQMLMWLKHIADSQNSLEAQVLLADVYEGRFQTQGLRVEPDPEVSLSWRMRAAENGHIPSIEPIASYLEQKIDASSRKRAFDLRLQLAKRGHGKSQLTVAASYALGVGVTPDSDQAEYWIMQAVEAKTPGAGLHETAMRWTKLETVKTGEAYVDLAKLYEAGTDVAKDLNKAFRWYLRAASKDNTEAQYRVGLCYEEGIGVEQDTSKALESYLQASAKDHVEAMKKVATYYESGDVVPRDVQKAIHYLERAWQMGDGEALKRVLQHRGIVKGDGSELKTQLDIFIVLADSGDIEMQLKVGDALANGDGTKMDKKKAVEWYRRAADAGNVEAHMRLAACYENGDGVPINHEFMLRWFEKAASQNVTAAQLRVAQCYEEGKGTSRDTSKAFSIYKKLADDRVPEAMTKVADCYLNGVGVKVDRKQAYQLYGLAAQAGSQRAAVQLIRCVQMGWGVDADPDKAFELLEAAAAAGNAEAQYELGRRYETGDGVEANTFFATMWYSSAEALGNPRAAYALGHCYAKGIGVAVIPSKSFEMFSAAANRGLPEAELYLAQCYESGTLVVQQDVEKAFMWYCRAASHGNTDAMFDLARCYANGLGTHQDPDLAFQWYCKSAEGGSLKGMIGLGTCYMKGLGVRPEPATALKYYTEAAAQQSPQAHYLLGRVYYQGEGGIKRDLSKATKYYQEAARLGHPGAQVHLGWMHMLGSGTGVNFETALNWYMKAAQQNDPHAQEVVGRWTLYGIGTEKDPINALVWICKAANRGNTNAMVTAAWCYLNGVGTARDREQCIRWLRKAAEMGDADAQFYLSWLLYVEQLEKKDSRETSLVEAERWLDTAATQRHDAALRWKNAKAFNQSRGYKGTIMQPPIQEQTAFLSSPRTEEQYVLGLCNEYGIHVKTDLLYAHSWYHIAAENGDEDAMYRLGLFEEFGKLGEIHPQKAFKWYLKAAEQGHNLAQLSVSVCYEHGFGVEYNPGAAEMWRKKFAAQGRP